MRKLILFFWLFLALQAHAVIALVSGQVAEATSASCNTTLAATFPAATTAGNIIIVVAGLQSNTITMSVTDDKSGGSNTYTARTKYTSSTSAGVQIFYAENAGAATNVTVTVSSAVGCAILIAEFSGVATSGSYDTENGAGSGGASVTTQASGNITTAQASELLISGLRTNNNTTVHAASDGTGGTGNYTVDASTDVPRLALGYLIESSTCTCNASWTWTTGANAVVDIAAFIAAPAVTTFPGSPGWW